MDDLQRARVDAGLQLYQIRLSEAVAREATTAMKLAEVETRLAAATAELEDLRAEKAKKSK